MKNLVVSLTVIIIFSCVGSSAHAIFVLDPEKDMKVIKKEVVNEDGTTSIFEEVIITKPAPTVHEVETNVSDIKSKTRVTHARGWDRKLGKYEPREPIFTVIKTRPKNWPIPEKPSKARKVPTIARTHTKGIGLHRIVSLICLGIIGYAVFRFFVYMRKGPDPNKA